MNQPTPDFLEDEEQGATEVHRIAINISKVCDGEATLLMAGAMHMLLKTAAELLPDGAGIALLNVIGEDLQKCAKELAGQFPAAREAVH